MPLTRSLNPAELSRDDASKLFLFFQEQKNQGINYWKKNEIYTFHDGSQFTFSFDILARERKKGKEGLRYEFIDHSKLLGKGSFGGVYEILGTLALSVDDCQFKEKPVGKKRVVKIQEHDEADKTLTEFEHSQEPHLAVKKMVVIQNKNDEAAKSGSKKFTSYMVMRKIEGRTLREILDDDRSYKKVLSEKTRLELTKALLKALKEQVSDLNLIHRDIKEDNIIVDESTSPMTIIIIDFGLSTKIDKPNRERSGTKQYVAPEVFNAGSVPTAKADVYSLARVLCHLWHSRACRTMHKNRTNLY